MSDKTFGVKVSEEVYDKVKSMVETSGVSAKEWFEKAVALTAVQDLRDGSGDYKQDLSELELHTSRIYELVANMIQRANYLKDDAVKALETKLESRELTITGLQSDIKAVTENLKQLEETTKQAEEEKQSLTEQVEGLRAGNENNQALIQEYKEKIDTLSSLVNEYKGFATENVQLKETHAAEKEQMEAGFKETENQYVSSIDGLNKTTHDLKEQIGKLNSTIEDSEKEAESLKVNFENQLIQLTGQKDLEKERAILEVERKYQEKLQQLHEQYNEKIAAFYEKFERTEDRTEKENNQ